MQFILGCNFAFIMFVCVKTYSKNVYVHYNKSKYRYYMLTLLGVRERGVKERSLMDCLSHLVTVLFAHIIFVYL